MSDGRDGVLALRWMADLVCEGFVKGFDRCKFLWSDTHSCNKINRIVTNERVMSVAKWIVYV